MQASVAESSGGVSVVLPAYNEEENVESAVVGSIAALSRIGADFEVLIVDDGSADRTAEIALALVEDHYPRVRLISHDVNRGYGAALRAGFEHSEQPLVFFTDADNQFDVAELEAFLPMMRDHDMAVGYRATRQDPFFRSVTSRTYNRIVRLLFRLHVRDVNCAFKLMRRAVVEDLPLECDTFFVSAELCARARRGKLRVAERQVTHYPRAAGETTVRIADVPTTLRDIARMWWRIDGPGARKAGGRASRAIGLKAASEFLPAPEGEAVGT